MVVVDTGRIRGAVTTTVVAIRMTNTIIVNVVMMAEITTQVNRITIIITILTSHRLRTTIILVQLATVNNAIANTGKVEVVDRRSMVACRKVES